MYQAYRQQLQKATTTGKNILVYFLEADGKLTPSIFKQCILDFFGKKEDTSMEVFVQLIDNKLIIADRKNKGMQQALLTHPSFCPFHHLTETQAEELPSEILNRGTNVGVSVLVESSDGKILLSRRAAHLRTFPGIWVPPGGHIEENETLEEAGLRELEEEVGIQLKSSHFVHKPLKTLLLWESCYPAQLTVGPPKRHHVVTYLYGKLAEQTSAQLTQQIKMDPMETDACIWVDREMAQVIDLSREDANTDVIVPDDLPKTVRCVEFDSNNEQVETDIDVAPLFFKFSGNGRVSSGTKMALHRWLQLK